MQRAQKKTVLIYGEGATEKAFLEYIKSVYTLSGNYEIRIRQANGNPDRVIDQIIKEINIGYYNEKYAFIDTDVPLDKTNQLKIEKLKIKTIKSSPTIEILFLEILLPDFNREEFSTSAKCKAKFKELLGHKRTTDIDTYREIFPKELLNRARNNITALDAIIGIFYR